MKHLLTVSMVVICAVLLLAMTVDVKSDVQRSYTEDFLTDQYKDTLNTTVNWNTSDGQLELPLFTPSFIGYFDTPGNAVDAAVSGTYVYVADQLSGLHVIDISDPANPTLKGSYDTNGNAQGVAVSGMYAYVADDVFDLKIIDISNPTAPSQVGAADQLPGNALSVTVSGGYAFLANGGAGLLIVDVSDPTAPVMIGSYNTPGWARDVAVEGNYAYVGDSFSGLQVIDITDPTAPSLIGNYDTAGSAGGVDVDGQLAYVAEQQTGLLIFDIGDPANPVLLESMSLEGSPWDVKISGDHALVTARSAGFHMIDVSNPLVASIVRTYNTAGDAFGVTYDGNYAYVSDFTNGLQVLRISNPARPSLVGSNTDPLRGLGISVSGNYAYISDRDFVLRVIDISDPTIPISVGSFYRQDYDTRHFVVHGDYGFLANGVAGLKVLDMTDPTSPLLAGNFTAPGRALRVVIAGDLLFLAADQMGLQILDISDPVVPTLVGAYYNTPGYSKDVALSGHHAFVADENGGLLVFDVGDTTNPTIIGSFDSPGQAMGVAVSGVRVYLADGDAGLHILDISNPADPVLIGSMDTPGNAEKVVVAGDWAFVADASGGLLMIDVSDPSYPVLYGTHDPGFGSLYDVVISGEHAFVCGMFGMQVVEVFQRKFHLGKNMGQSLNLNQTGKEIVQVKIQTNQAPDISWEISADNGAHWQDIAPDGNWNSLINPGIDLIWRSIHGYTGGGVNPICSNLDIEWFLSIPVIESISDIPDDQGRQLRLTWSKSGYDEAASSPRIIEYSIYRMIDHGTGPAPFAVDEYRKDPEALQYPPGDWDYVMTVPADGEESYTTVVPTLVDSTGMGGTSYTAFFVRARTDEAGLYYDSFIDSGYSIDNLPPAEPQGFTVTYETGGNHLTWDPSPDEDFHYFNIYRALGSDEASLLWERVERSTGIAWDDSPEYGGWNVSYKLTAVDSAGNESPPSVCFPDDATGIQTGNTPQKLALHQNAPNPFNPATTIFFDVPTGAGMVTLRIFDVRGALVRTLVNGNVSSGHKEARWDGTDEGGQQVSSGIYFYRLTSGNQVLTRKMVLLK